MVSLCDEGAASLKYLRFCPSRRLFRYEGMYVNLHSKLTLEAGNGYTYRSRQTVLS